MDPAVAFVRAMEYLPSYLRDHRDVLRHARFKDPSLGFLMATEKART